MANVLSQSEVEALLTALEPSAGSQSPRAAARGTLIECRLEQGPQQPPDDGQPDRVYDQQLHALEALHERFGRELAATLSEMLRTDTQVKLVGVDRATYSKFVASLPNPTCVNVLKLEGVGGRLVLELNPAIVFPIVDRLLGGGRTPRQPVPHRPLTEIEQRLVSRVVDAAIGSLHTAWSNVCDLRLSVSQTESDPRRVQIIPPDEAVVLIRFEVVLGETRGAMSLCFPMATVEPFAERLSSDSLSDDAKRGTQFRQKLDLQTGPSRDRLEMVVQLAETHVTAGDLTNLGVGDVIVTETDRHAGLRVLIAGRPMFLGSAGLYQGRKAVRLGTPLAPPQDSVREKRQAETAPAPPHTEPAR